MFPQFALLDLGTPQLMLILLIVLLLFGTKKLPELSRSVGESIKELKNAASTTSDIKAEVQTQLSEVKQNFASENRRVN